MAADTAFRAKAILEGYKFVDVELADTNYPLAEEMLEEENHVIGTLAYSDQSAYAEFKVENPEPETLFEIYDIIEVREENDGVYIETEDFYWSFLTQEE